MRFVLNLLWFTFAGFWLALLYFAAGVFFLIFIFTIPFSLAAFRIGGFCLWPFGRTLVPARGAGVFSGIGNVLWILLAGWLLAVGHLITGVLLCLTIVGIPFGIANFKLIPVSLLPLGSRIVPIGSPEAALGVAV